MDKPPPYKPLVPRCPHNGKSNEPRQPEKRIISDEFRAAINAATKRPLQLMATAVNYKISKFERAVKGELLIFSDIWPLLKIAQLIGFKGEFFKKI